ncbi:putative holin-like toxin [Clostridium botulinum]|uniref:Putative holin-like toxin n=1 Tax=Clostridium botulinum TaxID=1491 RepID=A0A0M1LKE1_CLOBO|nr:MULTISPECIES: putative holin-like toxin [Clostridium]KAI3347240.1 putative holin-like toxin [Clostridium botulinum]KOM87086.1 flagellar MS-ring protein [Clostridium botulinum]KOR58116.1 flagellar MS-ring protein [Clostridium botulinum]MBN1075894.1 putative holin-like toxin [Clostridium botulinum]MCS6112036.1 putative holin-like toxin [Clostridium botulinum]
MSNDVLMLLFQGGLFLISLLTLIVILIEKISKK